MWNSSVFHSPSQRDLEIHRFFLLSQKIPSSLSLSSSSPRKCSQNPTTGADKSHKPNHLQLVKSSSASTSPGIPAPAGETSGDPRLGSKNLTARTTRKQRKAHPPRSSSSPLRRRCRQWPGVHVATFVFVSTSRDGRRETWRRGARRGRRLTSPHLVTFCGGRRPSATLRHLPAARHRAGRSGTTRPVSSPLAILGRSAVVSRSRVLLLHPVFFLLLFFGYSCVIVCRNSHAMQWVFWGGL